MQKGKQSSLSHLESRDELSSKELHAGEILPCMPLDLLLSYMCEFTHAHTHTNHHAHGEGEGERERESLR